MGEGNGNPFFHRWFSQECKLTVDVASYERGGEGNSLKWGKFLMSTGHLLCRERSVAEGKTRGSGLISDTGESLV